MKLYPFCKAGCGQRVKHRRCVYCSPACVPSAIRAAACRKGRRTFSYRCKAKRFRQVIDRVLDGRKSVTRERLLDMYEAVHQQSYNSGFQVGRRLGQLLAGKPSKASAAA